MFFGPLLWRMNKHILLHYQGLKWNRTFYCLLWFKSKRFINIPKCRNKRIHKSLEFISVDAVQCKFLAWFTRSLWFRQSYFPCSELSLTLKLWRTMWPARECFWLWNSITELTLKSSSHILWIVSWVIQ